MTMHEIAIYETTGKHNAECSCGAESGDMTNNDAEAWANWHMTGPHTFAEKHAAAAAQLKHAAEPLTTEIKKPIMRLVEWLTQKLER